MNSHNNRLTAARMKRASSKEEERRENARVAAELMFLRAQLPVSCKDTRALFLKAARLYGAA